MISQRKLAKLLHLSQATVSRALRDDQTLPLETILRVKRFAKEVGHVSRRYTPHAEQQPERNHAFRLLALMGDANSQVVTSEGSATLEIIQSLIQTTKKYNIDLIIKHANFMPVAKSIVAEYCNNVLGCIMIQRFSDDVAGFLNANFFCLSINHYYDELGIMVIEADQENAFDQMFQYLHEHGHRRIGFLTVAYSRAFLFRRYAGYLRSARRLNHHINHQWVINTTSEAQLDFNEMLETVISLNRNDGVTAFLCTSGSLAKDLIYALDERGIKVPEDISFGAFDEIITPMRNGQKLYGAQADYGEITHTAIEVLRQFSLFKSVATIACASNFHYGSTVASLTDQMMHNDD